MIGRRSYYWRYRHVAFVTVPIKLIPNNELTTTDLQVFLYLSLHGIHSVVRKAPDTNELIEKLSLSKQSISTSIAHLKKMNFIEKKDTSYKLRKEEKYCYTSTVPVALIGDTNLTKVAIRIYMYYSFLQGYKTEAFPSPEKVQKACNISQSCFKKHFELLISLGYLKKSDRGYCCCPNSFSAITKNDGIAQAQYESVYEIKTA